MTFSAEEPGVFGMDRAVGAHEGREMRRIVGMAGDPVAACRTAADLGQASRQGLAVTGDALLLILEKMFTVGMNPAVGVPFRVGTVNILRVGVAAGGHKKKERTKKKESHYLWHALHLALLLRPWHFRQGAGLIRPSIRCCVR